MSSSFRAKQHGAALLLGIALLALIALAWRERASLSQLFMAQQTLNQATAAAVLTAAQFHARRLNAHAFLNRTMVAHRVAMAHLITIASAEKMRIEMSRQATRNNPPVFLIGLIFGQQHAAAYAAAKFGPAGQTQQAIEELPKRVKRSSINRRARSSRWCVRYLNVTSENPLVLMSICKFKSPIHWDPWRLWSKTPHQSGGVIGLIKWFRSTLI